MEQNTVLFLDVLSILGWMMCCFFSFHWIKEDCGCKHQKEEEAEYYADADADADAYAYVDTNTDTNEVVVDAIVVQ